MRQAMTRVLAMGSAVIGSVLPDCSASTTGSTRTLGCWLRATQAGIRPRQWRDPVLPSVTPVCNRYAFTFSLTCCQRTSLTARRQARIQFSPAIFSTCRTADLQSRSFLTRPILARSIHRYQGDVAQPRPRLRSRSADTKTPLPIASPAFRPHTEKGLEPLAKKFLSPTHFHDLCPVNPSQTKPPSVDLIRPIRAEQGFGIGCTERPMEIISLTKLTLWAAIVERLRRRQNQG